LRLRQVHNGVFVKLNKATWNMIRVIEPLVTYGYPTRQTISKLIYKKGFGKVNRSRIPLTDNSIIDGELGKFGIKSVEDLIHEIYTVGPHFKEANNFLWPFKLSSPLGGFEIKRHAYAERYGAFGDRAEEVNKLIKRMIWIRWATYLCQWSFTNQCIHFNHLSLLIHISLLLIKR